MARKRQPFYSKPHRLNDDLLDRGLGGSHVALLDDLWRMSSEGSTDGILVLSRAKASRLWDEEVARELVIASAIKSSEVSIDLDASLCSFLDVNSNRAEIDELREKRSRAGREGGKARKDGPRLPDNTFAPTTCPVHGTPWVPSKFTGLYCKERAAPGGPADKNGFCAMTPALAQASVWNGEASVWNSEANEWYQRNGTTSLRDVRTEPDDSAKAPSPISASASGRVCPLGCGGTLSPAGQCDRCKAWSCPDCGNGNETRAMRLADHEPGCPAINLDELSL
jgi:hypothetical protein